MWSMYENRNVKIMVKFKGKLTSTAILVHKCKDSKNIKITGKARIFF